MHAVLITIGVVSMRYHKKNPALCRIFCFWRYRDLKLSSLKSNVTIKYTHKKSTQIGALNII